MRFTTSRKHQTFQEAPGGNFAPMNYKNTIGSIKQNSTSHHRYHMLSLLIRLCVQQFPTSSLWFGHPTGNSKVSRGKLPGKSLQKP